MFIDLVVMAGIVAAATQLTLVASRFEIDEDT